MLHGTNYEGAYYKPTTAELIQAGKVAYFGWYQERGTYGSDGNFVDPTSLKQYAFTQQLVWETLNQSNGRFVEDNIQNEYIAFKNEVNQKMTRMQARPSIDGTTVTIKTGETTILTDSNGVLADYNSIDVTENGIKVTHNKGENTMQIQVSEDCTAEKYIITDDMFKNWGLIKEGTENKNTTVYLEFADGVQNQLYSLNYNDPVALRINLGIEALGRLELSKFNENGDLVDGCVYHVEGDNYNEDVMVSGGKIVLEKLKSGIYLISEKSVKHGYLINTQTYRVNVESGQTATQAIVNDEPIGELTLIKTDIDTGNQNRVDNSSHHGDATLKGTSCGFYAETDIYNAERTVKYFNANEKIANFVFDEYGNANINIVNSSTPAEIYIRGNKLCGLPMRKLFCKRGDCF